MFIPDTHGSGALMAQIVFPRTLTFPAGFAGSPGHRARAHGPRAGAPQRGELFFAGAAFGKASARLSARIVDLEDACFRPGGAARATGIRGYAHVMIYGVIVLSSLQQPACDRLSSALVQALEPSAATAP